MSISEYLESVESHLKNQSEGVNSGPRQNADKPPHCFITISRQAGAGAISIGNEITDCLNNDKKIKWPCPWTVIDKHMVNTILEEHHLPEKFKKYLPESKISQIDDILGELMGLHPSSIALVHRTSETILHLVHAGNVVVVGRGANIITRGLQGGTHIRIVGSEKRRIHRVMEHSNVSAKEAGKLISQWDKGRKKYFKEYFNVNIEDPLLYDLTINTDYVSYKNAANIIVHSMLCSLGLA